MPSPEVSAMLALAVDHTKVSESKDIRRVRGLPVDRWQDRAEGLASDLTLKLGKPGNTMKLRPIQGAMLETVLEHRGGFFPARTGGGKTLSALLIPTVLDARRAVLLVPASRRAPTYEAVRTLSKFWDIRPLSIVSYSDLSQAKNHTLLERLNPDVIIADEAHALKDSSGARWKRINRVNKSVPFVAMSGTFANRDMMEYRHLVVRALGDKAPVPLDYITGVEWSRCLNPRDMSPLEPGALLSLMQPSPEDGVGYDAARSRFGRRVCASPGVVSSGSDVPDIELTFSEWNVPGTPAMQEAKTHMDMTWTTPCGYPIDTAVDKWRHEGELALGLYYRWAEIPPQAWLEARKELAGFIRKHTSGHTYDLPSQVEAAVDSGVLKDPMGVFGYWREQEPEYTPVMKPVWLCDSSLKLAAEWLARKGGIVWVAHSVFGEQLSKMTGVPFFRQGACDPTGKHIEQHHGPAIASLKSCSTGHNLQHHQKNLFTYMASPTILEQAISRTHRDGQEKSVSVEFLLRLSGCHEALSKAKMDADTSGRLFQVVPRLLYGEWK